MFNVSVAGAFVGGTLALLSPCSALLLPAFFAYAFKSKTELAGRTAVFLLGLSTLLVPLGMGASFAGRLILDYRAQTIWIVGIVLIGFGILEIAGIGFSLWPRKLGHPRLDDSWGSVYVTGLAYGFAGFCSGPLLGAVLTMAAGATHPLHGALLLFVYAAGMAFPLFLLALLWDRYNLGNRLWLRGKPIRIGTLQIHSTNLISGLLFIVLGLVFVGSGGSVAFEEFYARAGLLHFSMNIQQKFLSWNARIPGWTWAVLLATAVSAVLILRWRRKQQL